MQWFNVLPIVVDVAAGIAFICGLAVIFVFERTRKGNEL